MDPIVIHIVLHAARPTSHISRPAVDGTVILIMLHAGRPDLTFLALMPALAFEVV